MKVLNVRDVPYVYTEQGHVLGAFESLDVDAGGARVRHGLETGHLREIKPAAPVEAPPEEGAAV